MIAKILAKLGWRNQTTVDSANIRRGDGVFESLTSLGGQGGIPSEHAALAVTAVTACVQLVAGAIASLPMHVYRRNPADGDLQRDVENERWWLLNEEWAPRWPASAAWAFLTGSKLLHGDGFAEIVRTPNGAIKYLVPLHPNRVKPIATPDGMRLVYEIKPDPTIEAPDDSSRMLRVLDQDDVLHIAGFGFNGLRSMSALRHSLSIAGKLAINAQDFSSKFLENMARPDFALSTEQALTDEQFARLREMLDQHKGPLNAGKPMILEGGLSVSTLTMPLEEMQLLETRKFQVEEIARAFGVPAFMIGHTEKTTSWGTGVESMGKGFVRFTLRDHLNAFQNEINRKFWPRSLRYVAEFDTTELERADTKALFDAIRVGLGRAGEPAVITVPEARRMLRMPRRPDGDLPTNEPATPEPAPASTTEEPQE